ncbi:DNA topoisomerase 1 [Streptomyces fumanus]
MTLDDALKLMSLPRVVGTDTDGTEITAQNGRYGPYLKKGTDSRSLQSEEQLFTITLEEAQAIYAQPKQRGRAAAKPPLKELGTDPVSEKPVVVKDGRFGPYVTDGETNATLRSGDSVETITPERGFELLAEKRAKGPAKKTAKKTAAKKTAAKKAPAKKTAAKNGRREEDDHREEDHDGEEDRRGQGVGGLSQRTPRPGVVSRRFPGHLVLRASFAPSSRLVRPCAHAARTGLARCSHLARETNAPASIRCRGGRTFGHPRGAVRGCR